MAEFMKRLLGDVLAGTSPPPEYQWRVQNDNEWRQPQPNDNAWRYNENPAAEPEPKKKRPLWRVLLEVLVLSTVIHDALQRHGGEWLRKLLHYFHF